MHTHRENRLCTTQSALRRTWKIVRGVGCVWYMVWVWIDGSVWVGSDEDIGIQFHIVRTYHCSPDHSHTYTPYIPYTP